MIARLLALLLFCSPLCALDQVERHGQELTLPTRDTVTLLASSELVVSTPIALRPYVGGANIAETIFVQGFDPALGTLTAVKIDLETHEVMSAKGENKAPGAAFLVWKTQAGLALSSMADETLFIAPFNRHGYSKRCTAYDGVTDFGGSSGFTIDDKDVLQFFSIYQAGAPAELQRFVGAGTKPFKAWRMGENEYTGATGKAIAALKHLVGGRLIFTYVYTPAP